MSSNHSIKEILESRSSVRAFTDKVIDGQLIDDIFTSAQRSVSNCNVQPWQSRVVTGEMRNRLEKELLAQILGGAEPTPDFDWLPRYKDVHRERQFGSANALYGAMSIERTDKRARQASMLRNWSFFDAPHVVFFCMDKYLGIMGAVDMGIYAQSLSLLMEEQGISSCMQGALGQFPDPIRDALEIPDDQGILFGMSFGYADGNAAVNKAKTNRANLGDAVQFYS